MSPNPSLERDLHRHGTWPASPWFLSSASRAKHHAGSGPSAQTLGRTTRLLRAAMSEVRLFPLDGGLGRHPEVVQWFAKPDSELRSLAMRWFEVLRATGPDVLELLHDGCPTACVSGVGLGYVAAHKAHVNVGFFLGATLPDPSRLLQGTGRFMRHVKVQPGQPLDEHALEALIASAYADLKARLARR